MLTRVSLWTTALALLAPSTVHLALVGLPISSSPKLAVFGVLVLFVLCSYLAGLPVKAGVVRPFRPADWFRSIEPVFAWTILIVALGLIGIRAAWLQANTIQACYVLAQASPNTCTFSADQAIGRPPDGSWSRNDAQLEFDPRAGYPWRLGGLNTLAYNIYDMESASPPNWRQAVTLRDADANPFSATYTLKPAALQALSERAGSGALNLTVQYRGRVDVITNEPSAGPERRSLPFTRAIRSEEVKIDQPDQTNLSFTFANWICASESATPDDCLASLAVQSLSEQDAVLNVRYRTSEADLAPITDMAIQPPVGDRLFALASTLQGGLLVVWVGFVIAAIFDTLLQVGASRVVHGWSVRTLAVIPAASFLAWLGLQAATFLFRDVVAVSRRDLSDLYLPVVAGLTAIGAAVVLWPGVRGPFLAAVEVLGDRAVLGLLFIPSLALAVDRFRGLPAVDPVELFDVGNDPLTYASWGRSILEHPRPFVEATAVFSKPLFPYWRALEYLLYGDGTLYARELLSVLFLVAGLAVALFAALVFVVSTCPTNRMQHAFRGIAWLLTSAATIYLCLSVSRLAAPWVPGYSEGPAWLFAILGLVACVLAPIAVHARALYFQIGWLLGISLLFRTNQLLVVAVFPFVLLALSARCSWREVLGIVAPVALCLAVIFVHALLDVSAWKTVDAYVQNNTVLSTPGIGSRGIAQLLGKLIPAPGDRNLLLLAAVTAGIWPLAIITLQPRALRGRALARATLAAVAIAAFAFGAQLPLITAAYYPRVLMLSYYVLAGVAIVVALSWRSSAAYIDAQ